MVRSLSHSYILVPPTPCLSMSLILSHTHTLSLSLSLSLFLIPFLPHTNVPLLLILTHTHSLSLPGCPNRYLLVLYDRAELLHVAVHFTVLRHQAQGNFFVCKMYS